MENWGGGSGRRPQEHTLIRPWRALPGRIYQEGRTMRNLTWINGHALIEGLEDGALSGYEPAETEEHYFFFSISSRVFVFIVMQPQSLALAGTNV